MGTFTTGNSTPRTNRSQIVGAAVCAAAVGAVVIAVALGTWRSAAPSRHGPSPAISPADQRRAAAGADSDGTSAPSTEVTRRDAVTVYLAASVKEADAIEQSGLLRASEGAERDGSILVLPAGTAEERARVRVVVQDLRRHLGNDKVHIVDLPVFGSAGAVAPRTVLVVDPAHETGLLHALGAGDAIADSLGLSPVTVADLRSP
jgi:hypothetical protein